MNNMRFFPILLLLLFTISGCIDTEFTAPPVEGEELTRTGNTSIAALKELLKTESVVEISEDVLIQGIVVANDRSGNFFRELILQDETGGIHVLVNLTSLYNFYPVGRELVIDCKGAFLGVDAGVTQLGGYTYEEDGNLELGEIIDYNTRILKGRVVGAPAPVVKSIDELGPADISTLVKLENVEFAARDLGLTYAVVEGNRSANRTLESCDNNREIILRSSGFADFAGVTLPEGSGSVTAIYSVFRDDAQLLIRDLEDVMLAGERCTPGSTGSGGSVSGNETSIGIDEVRQLFGAGTTAAPAERKIRGIVTSDGANGNWAGRNLVLEDGSGGIVIRFQDNHSYSLNDEIEVVISGQELSEFNGLLQINEVPNGFATRVNAGATLDPRLTTISELLNNFDAWESTLIRLENVTLSGSGSFSGSITVVDQSGSMPVFTRSGATFANAALPAGMLELTAVVSDFNGPQLILRNLEDVVGGETTGGGGGQFSGEPVDMLDEAFSSLTNNASVILSGWTNVALKGTRVWQAKSFDGNTYAQATAFSDNNAEMETWLITPPVDLAMASNLSFESAQAFYTHDGLSVWISTDFDGSEIGAATWTELEATLAGSDSEEHSWVPSGNIDLSSFSGTGYIAFRHVGNPDTGTTSYRIDNVKIE